MLVHDFVLLALADVPGAALAGASCDALGARETAWRFLLASGSLLLVLGLVQAHVAAGGPEVRAHHELYVTMTSALSLVGKTAVSGSFGAALLLTSQTYPTKLRTAGLGLGTAIGKVGASAAPPLAALVAPATALGLTGLGLFAAALATSALPEQPADEPREAPPPAAPEALPVELVVVEMDEACLVSAESEIGMAP